MKFLMTSGILGLTALMAAGCATSKDMQQTEKKIEAEEPVARTESFANRGANIFMEAEGLSDTQRSKLVQIHAETYEKAVTLRDEITKTKTALFKSLIDPSTSKKEINTMKNRVVQLDKQRLDLMLKAFDQVRDVVGKETIDRTVIDPFMRIGTEKF